MPNTANPAFDQALEMALAQQAQANAIRRRDVGDMARRRNLQRYGSDPTTPDVQRLAAGVPLPAQQYNFADAPSVAMQGKMATANARLAGDFSDRHAPRPGSVADNQLRLGDAPDDGSTFVDGRGVRHLAGPANNAPTRTFDRKLMDAIGTAHALADEFSDASGTPERAQATYTDENGNQRTVISNAPMQRAMQDRRLERLGLDKSEKGLQMAGLLNLGKRMIDQQARQQAVVDRAKDRSAYGRLRAIRNGDGPMYDPASSAMLGAAMGMFTGNPGLAADFARGAADANQSMADLRQRRDENDANRGLQRDALDETRRHNQAGEGLQGQQLAEDRSKRQQDAITRDPLYIYAMMLGDGDERRGKIMAYLNDKYSSPAAGAAGGAAGAPVVPAGGAGALPNGIFDSDPEADMNAGKMTDEVYKHMRKSHPANMYSGWPDWWTTRASYLENLKKHFHEVFPNIPDGSEKGTKDLLTPLVTQYYHRYANE